SPLDEQETLTFMVGPSDQTKVETEPGTQKPADEKNDTTGAFSFGPDWLKSLGAMPMESDLPPETETPALPDLSAEPSIEAESPAVWKPPVALEALEEALETPAPATSSLEPAPA